jgi:hypothetical protein
MSKPKVGDEAWFVEWVSELAFDECNDLDRDNCKRKTGKAATRDEAEKIAKDAWPEAETLLGYVEYWPSEFFPYDEEDAARYPHAGYWNATGDVEVYEGDPHG